MALEYTVVSDRRLHYLESRVNEKIRSGWAPTGGIAVKPTDRQFKDMEGGFYQAMVREPPLEQALEGAL